MPQWHVNATGHVCGPRSSDDLCTTGSSQPSLWGTDYFAVILLTSSAGHNKSNKGNTKTHCVRNSHAKIAPIYLGANSFLVKCQFHASTLYI